MKFYVKTTVEEGMLYPDAWITNLTIKPMNASAPTLRYLLIKLPWVVRKEIPNMYDYELVTTLCNPVIAFPLQEKLKNKLFWKPTKFNYWED